MMSYIITAQYLGLNYVGYAQNYLSKFEFLLKMAHHYQELSNYRVE